MGIRSWLLSNRRRIIVIIIPAVIRVLTHGLKLVKYARMHDLLAKIRIDKLTKRITSVGVKITFYYITFYLRKYNQQSRANSRVWG